MYHFYVLRANREAGPFTRAELKAYGLLTTDLLWVDGESREWRHPAEVDGLEGIIVDEVKKEPVGVNKGLPAAVSTAPDLSQQRVVTTKELYPSEPESSRIYQDETIFRGNKKHTAVPYTIGARLFGIAVLLIGVLLCGFVAVNMWKQFDARPAAVSEAVEIHNETLTASNVGHTAEAAQITRPVLTEPVAEKGNTALKEMSLPEKPLKTSIGTTAPKAKSANKIILTTQATQTDDHKGTASSENIEEKPELPKPVRQPPSLQLSANDYKVGLFGGVSNLEITVANPSEQRVNKAVIEIEYLKPNGNVVRTQTVTAENLTAGGSKTIAVPSSGRGVKVRYHVVGVEAQD